MDLKTLEKAGKSAILKKHFRGIIFSNSTSKKNIPNGVISDFYFINTDHFQGEHWFTIIRAVDMWVICDCSELTPFTMYKNIICRLTLPVIIDRKELQQTTSLLCGEFALMAAILLVKLLNSRINILTYTTYPQNFYSNSIMKYSKKTKCNPDKLVYIYIYTEMKRELHINPERKIDVLQWLKRR